MGEAILFKALSGGGSGGNSSGKELYYFTINTVYTVPRTGNYRITCIGGGGGGGEWCSDVSDKFDYGMYYIYANYAHGGGSGYWNTKIFTLPEGSQYNITIGAGGAAEYYTIDGPGNGGITSFGNIISANGGSGYRCWRTEDRDVICTRAPEYGGNTNSFIFQGTFNSSTGAAAGDTSEANFKKTAGAVLYVNGANVVNTPTSGYEKTDYGAGGNPSYTHPTYTNFNSKYLNIFNNTFLYKYNSDSTDGNAGCVIVEFVN